MFREIPTWTMSPTARKIAMASLLASFAGSAFHMPIEVGHIAKDCGPVPIAALWWVCGRFGVGDLCVYSVNQKS